MKQKIKKLLTMGLSLSMVLGLIACGNTNPTGSSGSSSESESSTESQVQVVEEKDPITLHWYYAHPVDAVQKDAEKVNAAWNEMLQAIPGMEHVTVEWHPFSGKKLTQEVTLAQSAGDPVDMISTYQFDYAGAVADGTFISLDDRIAASESLTTEIPEWFYSLTQADGVNYVVPAYGPFGTNYYAHVPKVYMDKYANLDEYRTLLQSRDIEAIAKWMEDFVLAIREGEGIATKYQQPLAYWYFNNIGPGARKDVLSGNFVVEENSGKVVNRYFNDDMLTCYPITADWYERGIIMQDYATIKAGDFIRKNALNEVSCVMSMNNGRGTEEQVTASITKSYGFDTYAIPCYDNYYVPYNWANGGTGITASCEYPDEAFRVIELMHTKEGAELYNTMVYGIEGTHWAWEGDKINTFEYNGAYAGSTEISYGIWNWNVGNVENRYPNQGTNMVDYDMFKLNEDPSTVYSELAGFTPDVSKIENELAQCKAVETEYGNTLLYGVKGADWEKTFNEFKEKMIAAGMQVIIDELQSQVDAFLANK